MTPQCLTSVLWHFCSMSSSYKICRNLMLNVSTCILSLSASFPLTAHHLIAPSPPPCCCSLHRSSYKSITPSNSNQLHPISSLLSRHHLSRSFVPLPGVWGCCCRESWKLLHPLAQFQCFQHWPRHQRGCHHAAVRRVVRAQERCPAHPVSVGGHQLRRGAAHPHVHPHWSGGKDGRACHDGRKW